MTGQPILLTRPVPDLPKQSWVAYVRPELNAPCEVYHGTHVEQGSNWVFEGAWAGEFSEGRFDETDIVCGTGIRVTGDTVAFISAGSTSDRLVHDTLVDGTTLVSNSLVLLLTVTGRRLDPHHVHYWEDMEDLCTGLSSYRPALRVEGGQVGLCYFHNLHLREGKLTRVDKPNPPNRFHDFQTYEAFLEAGMRAIHQNASDPARKKPLGIVATCSSGYDSPALLALLHRNVPLRAVLTFRDGRSGGSDSGVRVAQYLGIENVVEFDREGWRSTQGCEWEFLMADGKGSDVNWIVAQDYLSDCILFQGQFADKLWTASETDLAPDLKRGDRGGLSLTEHRLRIGFGHALCPFWGGRDSEAIRRISVSPEMSPWSVESSYNRPIPRRIVETAGVPRGEFATRKDMIGVLNFWPIDMTREGRRSFYRFLRREGLDRRPTPWTQRVARFLSSPHGRGYRIRRGLLKVARPLLRRLGVGDARTWNPYFMQWAMSLGQSRLYSRPVETIQAHREVSFTSSVER